MENDEINSLIPKISTGEQGSITDTVLKIAEKIPGEGEFLIKNINSYLHSKEQILTEEPDFSRKADEIIQSNTLLGCHESGLVFATILRAKGQDVTYIESFLKEDLENYNYQEKDKPRGHIFLKTVLNGEPVIINSTTGEITKGVPENYVIGAEGLDSWDIGIKTPQDYTDLFERTKRNYESKGIGNNQNTKQSNRWPLKVLPGKTIGSGYESEVFMIGDDMVMKKVNLVNAKGEERSLEMIKYLRSPERIKEMIHTQKILLDIFGEEHFEKTEFIYANDPDGNEGFLLFQKFIPGKVLSELIGTEYKDSKEMVEKNRDQFKDIVWGLKKAFIVFGVPIDFHPGNLIQNKNTGEIKVIDTGIPSDEYTVVSSDKIINRTINTFEIAYRRLERINRYERFLNLSDEEKDTLNQKYKITDADYESRIQNLDEFKIKKGLEINVVDPVDQLLDTIFGMKEKVSGQEIFDYALKILGNNQPTDSQKNILGELQKQSTFLGDRSYWKNIIEL